MRGAFNVRHKEEQRRITDDQAVFLPFRHGMPSPRVTDRGIERQERCCLFAKVEKVRETQVRFEGLAARARFSHFYFPSFRHRRARTRTIERVNIGLMPASRFSAGRWRNTEGRAVQAVGYLSQPDFVHKVRDALEHSGGLITAWLPEPRERTGSGDYPERDGCPLLNRLPKTSEPAGSFRIVEVIASGRWREAELGRHEFRRERIPSRGGCARQ